jgi:hypothetical protein
VPLVEHVRGERVEAQHEQPPGQGSPLRGEGRLIKRKRKEKKKIK